MGETEQEVEEEKQEAPHAAVEAVPRGENCAVTVEDLDFGVEELEDEVVAEPEIAGDESDNDSLEELLDQLSDEETPAAAAAAAAGGEARKNSTEELEAELEMDLDNLKLDDIDTTDVNLDDEDLLED